MTALRAASAFAIVLAWPLAPIRAQDAEPAEPDVPAASEGEDVAPGDEAAREGESVEVDDEAAPLEQTPEPAPLPEAPSEPGAEGEGAQPGAPPAPTPALLEGARRAVPDLDGRPDPGVDPADALLWIPRILFAPLYLVAEYVLRRPIGEFLTTAERERWDLLQFAGRPAGELEWGLLPTIFIDFGFRAAGGLYVWFNNLGFAGNDVRVRLGIGGADWVRASVVDRVHFDEHTQLQAYFGAFQRPDNLFVGFGPSEAIEERESRYGRRRMEGSLSFTHRPWRSSQIGIAVGITANEFYDASFVEPPEQHTSSAAYLGWFPSIGRELPPGFGGYTAAWQRLEGTIDTREGALEADRSGVRVEAFVEFGWDIYRPRERRWVGYGGALGGYWDIDSGRTLGLWVATELATPFGEGPGAEPIPFTELPDIGARGRMAGFRRGWVTGPSAVSATLEYRYPIWAALDGFVSAAIGNAFGPELRDFDVEDMRTSFMFGLRTIGDPDHALTLQVGFGTRTFAQGLDPEVFRFTVGTQEGF